MAKNFIERGRTITVPVPAAGVTTGLGVLIGTIFGVALSTVAFAATSVCDLAVTGIWSLVKNSTDVWAVGDKIYWDNANARCTNLPGAGLRFIGNAAAAAANPTSSGTVRLAGTPAVLTEAALQAPASYATAGAQTYTVGDVLGGIIVRATTGASRTDTLPTAALLVAALPGVQVGDVITCDIINGATAAETITIAAGAGGGFDTNQPAASRVIGQNASKTLMIRFTNVTPSAEAYVAYL